MRSSPRCERADEFALHSPLMTEITMEPDSHKDFKELVEVDSEQCCCLQSKNLFAIVQVGFFMLSSA